MWKGIILLGLGVLLSSSAMSEAAAPCRTNADSVASLSKAQLEQTIKYASQGDQAAFAQMVISKRAFLLKPGVPVYIDERSWFLVKIRPEGQTFGVWTAMESVSCH